MTGAGSDFSLLKGVSTFVDFPSASTISINIIIRSCSGGLAMLRSKQRVDITSIKNERHSRRNLLCNLLKSYNAMMIMVIITAPHRSWSESSAHSTCVGSCLHEIPSHCQWTSGSF